MHVRVRQRIGVEPFDGLCRHGRCFCLTPKCSERRGLLVYGHLILSGAGPCHFGAAAKHTLVAESYRSPLGKGTKCRYSLHGK